MKKDTFLPLLLMCLIVGTSVQNSTDIGGTTPPPKGGGPTIVAPGNPFNPVRTLNRCS